MWMKNTRIIRKENSLSDGNKQSYTSNIALDRHVKGGTRYSQVEWRYDLGRGGSILNWGNCS